MPEKQKLDTGDVTEADKVADVEMEDGNEWTLSQLKIPTYLMNFPFSLRIDNPNNVFMKENKAPLDKDRAYAQWLKLYNFVASQAMVQNLPSKFNYGDLPYVANIGMYLPHDNKQIFVLANFTSPPRQGEDDVAKVLFEQMDYKVIKSKYKWEGEADLKFIGGSDGKTYIGGWGMRSQKETFEWFEKEFDMNIIKVRIASDFHYHLDCSVFPLTLEKTMVMVKNYNKDEIKAIEKHTEIIPIPEELYDSDPTNCVRMYNIILCSNFLSGMKKTDKEFMTELKKIQFLEKVCAENGMELVTFNISEFSKSGAALSCQILNMNFRSYFIPIT